jgi:hypothetical protein
VKITTIPPPTIPPTCPGSGVSLYWSAEWTMKKRKTTFARTSHHSQKRKRAWRRRMIVIDSPSAISPAPAATSLGSPAGFTSPVCSKHRLLGSKCTPLRVMYSKNRKNSDDRKMRVDVRTVTTCRRLAGGTWNDSVW